MDQLTQILLNRASQPVQQTGANQAQAGLPSQIQSSSLPSVLPNPTRRLPSKIQRWSNAQQLQDAYRGGWTPNPVLLQASQK